MCLDDTITCCENSPDDLYEAAKQNMEQIQFSLQKIQHYEKKIVSISTKADLDIDDVLDFLLAKIMKLIRKKKTRNEDSGTHCIVYYEVLRQSYK